MVELTRLSRRQLQWLAEKGVVRASVQATSRRRVPVLYAPEDMLPLVAVERVRAVCGALAVARLRELSAAIRTVRAREERQLLIVDPEAAWLPGDLLDAALWRSCAVLVLDLNALAAETDLRMRRAGVKPPERAPK